MGRIAARLLLVVFGLALAVGAIELGLRLAGPNVPLDLTMARFQAYHPVYGFFHRPGVSGWLRTREFTSYVKFNELGFRGPDLVVPKPAGVFRLLVMGDSVVEGAQVAEGATMAATLPTAIADGGSTARIESVNAGVAGFGQAQELLMLGREGAAVQPDVIVLVITVANDVADNSVSVARRWKLAADRRPFFVIDPSGQLQLLPLSPPPAEPFERARAFARDRSILFNTLELWAIGKSVARAQESVVPPIEAEREVYLREPGEDWLQAWAVTERLLMALDEGAKAIGAPVVFVISPTQWQMSSAAWREFMGAASSVERRFGPEIPNERLLDIARRNGLRMIDLLAAFRREAAGEYSSLYFKQDGHWNERGHAVAAAEIAARLAEARLVAAP